MGEVGLCPDEEAKEGVKTTVGRPEVLPEKMDDSVVNIEERVKEAKGVTHMISP